MTEALCWATDTRPSQIAVLLWSHTHRDIKTILKIKVGYEQTIILQNYASISLLLNQAFGGNSKEQVKTPSNIMEAKQQLSGIFGNGK
ncbi:hypothetical protein [Kiloniella sp.]|uniref:hypothetical protein n=1 Tax=Kiloniella sp. TaxID=1938587 RepID=UPI003B0299D4